MRALIMRLAMICAFGAVVTAPPILVGFPRRADDAVDHVNWFSVFGPQLWSGELYPRWLADMNGGFGSPAFFFYPPLAHYAAAAFHPLVGDGWRALGLASALAVILSGCAAYAWLATLVSPRAALIGALVYIIMPYHLAVDLYTRAAYAELWAFVWLPLLARATTKVARGEACTPAGVAVAYALLIVTHLPTALLASPLPVVQAIVDAPPGRSARALLRVALGLGLGVGLAAVYLAPALLDRASLSETFVRDTPLAYDQWFIRLSGASNSRVRNLTLVVLLTACVGAWGAVTHAVGRGPVARRPVIFWSVVLVGAVLLMTPLARPVWEGLPLLQQVQFPYRFGTIATLAATALAAAGAAGLRREGARIPMVALTAGLGLAGLCVVSTAIPLRHQLTDPTALTPERRHTLDLKLEDYFLPRWAGADVRGRLKRDAQVIEGAGVVTVTSWQPRAIGLLVQAEDLAVVRIGQFYYAGWRAMVDGAPVAVVPSTRDGLLQLTVPSGRHEVLLSLVPGNAEQWGWMLSGITALLLVAILGVAAMARRRAALMDCCPARR
jgi:6-pyruvoyl-tetrahydropterin synthase related domain